MRRTAWAVLALAIVAAVATVAWSVRRLAPPSPGVIEASGRIEGDQAAIGAKIGGRIARMAVREGEGVERGQLIAELASEQVAAQLAHAEHVLHTAREQGEAIDQVGRRTH